MTPCPPLTPQTPAKDIPSSWEAPEKGNHWERSKQSGGSCRESPGQEGKGKTFHSLSYSQFQPESSTNSWIKATISQGCAGQSQDAMRRDFLGTNSRVSSQNREAQRHRKQPRKRRETARNLGAPPGKGQEETWDEARGHLGTLPVPTLPVPHGAAGTCRRQDPGKALMEVVSFPAPTFPLSSPRPWATQTTG